MAEAPETKRNWLMTLSKVTFFIVAFLLVIFTVMTNMGGSNDTLKEAVEQFLSQSTGYEAKVGTLYKMSFFPSVGVDVGDVTLTHPEGDAQITAERISVFVGFFDVAFSTGKIKSFSLYDMQASSGSVSRYPLRIDELAIVDEIDDDRAVIRGSGTLGPRKFFLQADMEQHGKKYKFGKKRKAEISIGDLDMEGVFLSHNNNVVVQDIVVGIPEKTVEGELKVLGQRRGKIGIGGDLQIGLTGSITPDISVDFSDRPVSVTGDLNSSDFTDADLKSMIATWDKIESVLIPEEDIGEEALLDLPDADIGIKWHVKGACLSIDSENFKSVISALRDFENSPLESLPKKYPCDGSS